MPSTCPSILSLPTVLLLFTTTFVPIAAQSSSNPILTSSFTWNPNCGSTVACGPSAAGYRFAASNNLTYAGCDNLGGDKVDCSAASIVSGVGKGCGQCWHITPQSDWFPSNGLSVGTSVVVQINDQCTDPGYCDQTEAHPVNTGYGKEVHIDLCAASGVTAQFFGAVGPGVVVGLAQLLPDCSALDHGPYGSRLGSLDASSSAASSSSSSSGSGSSSNSASDSSSSSASGSSSSSGSDSSSSSGSGSSSSSNSGSDSSSSSGSGSSNSGSSSSSSSGSDSSSSSGSGSSSNSGSSSSSNSESDASSKLADDSPTPDTLPSGSASGNWTWTGTKIAKHKLSSGHDGQKAGAHVVIGGGGGGGVGGSNAGSEDVSVSSSSSTPPTPSPAPTTLVPVVISNTAPPPVSSSSTATATDEQDGDDEGDDCDDGDVGEL